MTATGLPYYTYAVEPAHPNGHEEVRVRIDSPDGCFPGIAVAKPMIGDRTLVFSIGGSDAGEPGCPAATPVYRSFGVVPRGTYTLVVNSCTTNPLPGEPMCVVWETSQLLVGGGDPVVVPALGGVAAFALAMTIILSAVSRFAPSEWRAR